LVDLPEEAQGDSTFPTRSIGLGPGCPQTVVAAELAGDISTSQHFGPHADRTADLLEGGQHVGAEGQVGETRVGEGIRIASGGDLYEARVVLDI